MGKYLLAVLWLLSCGRVFAEGPIPNRPHSNLHMSTASAIEAYRKDNPYAVGESRAMTHTPDGRRSRMSVPAVSRGASDRPRLEAPNGGAANSGVRP
jgi:hypothetical protein